MKEILKRGATSNILRVFLPDSTSTSGAGKTGLTNSSSGLIISTIADVEATATTYTSAASNVETITTLGTFAAPSSGKARFKEVDATNFPGIYEIQIADARFNVSNAQQLLVSIQCTGVAPTFAEVQLVTVDLYDSTRFGLTALPNAAAEALGGLATLSANQSSGGTIPANMVAISGDTTAADNLETAADGGVYNLGGGGIVASSVTNNVGGNVVGNVNGNVAGSVNSVTNSVTVGGFSSGAITSTAFANSAITNSAINNGAISVNKIADGTITAAKIAAGAITSTTFAAAAIDANAIATDAITSAELATSAVNEIVDAVWSANIATNSAAAAWANDTMGKRVLRSSSNTDATEGVVADAVWEEPRGDHDTGNTMGHSLDQIRKANFTTEGTVNSTTGATTTSFRTNLTAVNDTYQHQTILFVNSVALNGQSAPILSYAQTNGVITLGDGLTVAPSLNDEFVILPTHVYPMSYIVTNILEGNTSTTSYAAGDVGNILARLHNMIAADGANFQFTANALELAPSGGDGGGSTTVRMGPFVIKAEGHGSDDPLDINKGATHAIECQLVDAEGTGVDITGATLTAKVYNSAGSLIETVSGTISYAALGQVRWIIGTTTTNTAGTYTVTITRTTGASDTQIFGPLRVYVRDI